MAMPQSELAIRDYLRTVPSILALVGNDARKIDADYSGGKDATHMTMFRAGGAPSQWVPLDDCVMIYMCWGRGRGAALALATELADTLRRTREVALNRDAWLRGSTVQATNWTPDVDGQPRYSVTAISTVSARESALL